MGSPEPSGARKREKGRVLSNATGGIDAAAAWPERGGAGNNQYSTNDERRDNGVNSAGWSTAGRRWGACARHRPRELRDRLILMDGYIDDDDDDSDDDDDIDGGDAVGVFRFFLLAPGGGGGGGGGDGERDGEVQSVSR